MQPFNYGAQGFNFDFMGALNDAQQLKRNKVLNDKDLMEMEKQKRIERIQGLMREKLAKDPNANITNEYNLLNTEDPAVAKLALDFNKTMDDEQQKVLYGAAHEALGLVANGLEDEAVKVLTQRNELLKAAQRDNTHTQQALDVYAQHGMEGLEKLLGTTVATGIARGYLDAENSALGSEWQTYAPIWDEKSQQYVIPQVNKRTAAYKSIETGIQKPEDEFNLTKDTEKAVKEWDTLAGERRKASSQAAQLARGYRELKGDIVQAGLAADIEQLYRGVTGTQDGESILRRNFDRFTNAQVIAGLPKGPASDTDIKIAMRGYPVNSTDPQVIAEYLDAMSRVLAAEELGYQMKAEFAEATGGITRARAPASLRGMDIEKGESYAGFIERYNARVDEERKNKNGGKPRSMADILNQYGNKGQK